MSFKVEIEIKGYDGQLCNECEDHLINTDGGAMCGIFLCLISPSGDFIGSRQIGIRCPECLEAEKQYKEKKNA